MWLPAAAAVPSIRPYIHHQHAGEWASHAHVRVYSPALLPESRIHNAHGEGAGCKEASTLQTRQLSMYNYSRFKIKIVHHVQSTCRRMYQLDGVMVRLIIF